MNTRLVPALLCLLAAGCSRYSYISSMEGEWTGSSINALAPGIIDVSVASFTYDEDVDQFHFDGQFDLSGWTYVVYTASSDRDYAQVEMIHNAGAARRLNLVDVVVDRTEGTMDGAWNLNICDGQANPDPATCLSNGTFTMTRLDPVGETVPTEDTGAGAAE